MTASCRWKPNRWQGGTIIGHRREYVRNPYISYDNINQKPFLYRGKLDDRLAPMERLITLSINRVDNAYLYPDARKQGVIHDRSADDLS